MKRYYYWSKGSLRVDSKRMLHDKIENILLNDEEELDSMVASIINTVREHDIEWGV